VNPKKLGIKQGLNVPIIGWTCGWQSMSYSIAKGGIPKFGFQVQLLPVRQITQKTLFPPGII
jgi:hypothetical protein